MAQKYLKKTEAAERLGISLRELERCVQDGMPSRGKPGKRTYPWPECRTWFLARIREQERRKLQPSSMAEAERRKAMADAEMAEEKLRAYRGQLVDRDLYRRELAGALLRIRTLIQSHPKLREVAPEILAQLADQSPEPLEEEAPVEEPAA